MRIKYFTAKRLKPQCKKVFYNIRRHLSEKTIIFCMLVSNFQQPHALALFGLNLLSSVPRKYLEIIVFCGFRSPKSLNIQCINLCIFCRPIWKYCCAINSQMLSSRNLMKYLWSIQWLRMKTFNCRQRRRRWGGQGGHVPP